MHYKLVHEVQQRHTFVLVFDKGDDPYALLTEFAEAQRLDGSSFSGIGAVSAVTVGWFNTEAKEYERTTVEEQCEVLSLLGDVAVNDDEPSVHAHITLARRDHSAFGGHLFGARVWPTLEVVLTESPTHLRKRMDTEVGLALIDLEQTPPVRSIEES